MSLPDLPNEIFSQILALLTFQDQKTCMLISNSWHRRFQHSVLQCLYINTRHQFKQLLMKLAHSYQTQHNFFGMLVRRLTLGSRVGIINSEFNRLPIYCPFLEYFDFNPLLWRYFTYTDNVILWNHLTRFPCMQRLKLTVPILRDTGRNITQLEMSPVMVDELAGTKYTIFSILAYTPNLLTLQLSNGIMVSQNISISEFESVHTLCPQLETLYLDSFDAHLLSKDGYLVDIETLPISSQLRNLRLDMSINSEEFLHYWAHKYPYIESLDIQLRLLEPEYYHEEVQPENSRMKESFALMATRFTQLKKLTARFDEQYFPCDVFLRGINSVGTKMEDVSTHFFNFDYHRRSARNFKLLMNNSVETMKHVKISNWDRSWDYEEDILEPMGQCLFLESLSLSPQPGTLSEFCIDIILDHCTHLKRLELANTYSLFVRDDGNMNIGKIHRLTEFSLSYTMVNNRLFDYLALRCPYLNTLDILHMTKPYDNTIDVKIDMPDHTFKSINIAGLQLGLRMEDSGFQCNCYSTICSLEETEKTQQRLQRKSKTPTAFYPAEKKTTCTYSQYPERWYHLYQPKQKHGLEKSRGFVCSSRGRGEENKVSARLQRLSDDNIKKIKYMQVTKQLWEQISFAGARLKYEHKGKWQLDIPYGYTSVRCRSVDEFKFEGISL